MTEMLVLFGAEGRGVSSQFHLVVALSRGPTTGGFSPGYPGGSRYCTGATPVHLVFGHRTAWLATSCQGQNVIAPTHLEKTKTL